MSRATREREFTDFARARTAALHRSAWMLCRDEHEAQDLVQETLTKVYLMWMRPLTRIDNPVAYTHTTLTRTFLSSRRKRSSTETPLEEFPREPRPGRQRDHAATAPHGRGAGPHARSTMTTDATPTVTAGPGPRARPRPGRRTVLRAAAWSAPALTVVGATPAFADSGAAGVAAVLTGTTQDVTPPGALRMLTTGSLPVGPTGHAVHAWVGNPTAAGYTSGDDLTATSTTARLTVTYTYSVPASSTFTVSTDVAMGYGTPPAAGHFTRQEVTIEVLHAGTTTVLARLVPATPTDASLAQRDQRVSDADLAAAGFTFHPVTQGNSALSTTTYRTAALTSSAGGPVVVRFTFVLPEVPKVEAQGGNDFYVHDDVTVTQPAVLHHT